ncbi:unnamed protein product [Chironomus riparius]|uniref:Uncharacterized protein n=1 Tax=Chironomus riparius TaxID=315576 RepID=A0A9N9RTA5_9DIPT|nr:unnamed protein product [Chironomus riparius]
MNSLKVLLLFSVTAVSTQNFTQIRSEIQEKLNENLLAKRSRIDLVAIELKTLLNDFKQHYQKIETLLCLCADKNDTKIYCKLINSEINLAYNSLHFESFPLELQAMAIHLFGPSIQLYEDILDSISNATNAVECLSQTKSSFIDIFKKFFETTRDVIIKSVHKLKASILVTQGEINKFVANRSAHILICTGIEKNICECSNEYISLNWKSTILAIKQFQSNVETFADKINDETIVEIAVKSGITEESMKSKILEISECTKGN